MAEIDILPRFLIVEGEIVYEERNEYLSLGVDAPKAIERILDEYGKALIVDLNGVFNNRPGLSFIKEFETKPIWVDAGVRLAENVIDIFVAGAEKVVMGTRTLVGLDEVREANKLSDQLVFQVEARDGQTIAFTKELEERTPGNLLEEAAQIGVDIGFYLESGRGDPYPSMLHGITDRLELYTGPLSPADSQRFSETGIHGIIVDARELI